MFKARQNLSKNKKRRQSSDESANSQDESSAVIAGTVDQKRKRHGVPDGTSTSQTKSQAVSHGTADSGSSERILTGEDALRSLDIDADRESDARTQYERIRDIQKKIDSGELEEGVYRGMKAYRAYIQPDDERKLASAKITGVLGPQRANPNVRSTSRFDYQMDVCKDYKESGYCGFGDSCKFLHDRSDYKSGWQVESEFNSEQRKLEKERLDKFQLKAEKRRIRFEQLRQEAIAQGLDPASVFLPSDDEEEEETAAPESRCCVCLKKWSDCSSPACVSLCNHYFCESCFLSTSTAACKACGKPTQGIFNSVH